MVRYENNNETHGILIGPHTSNIISEIILCKIDSELAYKWNYVRHIDDYTCYVDSINDAEKFILELNEVLRQYGFSINDKKTSIKELPLCMGEYWVHKIKAASLYLGSKYNGVIDYQEIQAFLDVCIKLAEVEGKSSILLFALKILSKKKMSKNAEGYFFKYICSVALMKPYLIPKLEKYIFSIGTDNYDFINQYINSMYRKYVDTEVYEATAYAIYYAIRCNVRLNDFNIFNIVKGEDCIVLLMALIYVRKHLLKVEENILIGYAERLVADGLFDQYWLFIFEALTADRLSEEWRSIKKKKVSFLKEEFI